MCERADGAAGAKSKSAVFLRKLKSPVKHPPALFAAIY